jgi:DNA polymerase-3 subunit chi
MSETWFYHLERRTLEEALPGLLERARERGWRVGVRVGSAERMEALDSHLWTYAEHSFLPHGTAADGRSARQPIYLTTEDDNPNQADALFLVGGASAAWDSPAMNAFTRIVLMFDGRDETALLNARAAWQEAKSAGHDVTYWKETPSGKFEKQG